MIWTKPYTICLVLPHHPLMCLSRPNGVFSFIHVARLVQLNIILLLWLDHAHLVMSSKGFWWIKHFLLVTKLKFDPVSLMPSSNKEINKKCCRTPNQVSILVTWYIIKIWTPCKGIHDIYCLLVYEYWIKNIKKY